MWRGCESIVGVPVTAPKSHSVRIEIRYTEVPPTIDKEEKDSDMDSASQRVNTTIARFLSMRTDMRTQTIT